jgi:hypothetical protein
MLALPFALILLVRAVFLRYLFIQIKQGMNLNLAYPFTPYTRQERLTLSLFPGIGSYAANPSYVRFRTELNNFIHRMYSILHH